MWARLIAIALLLSACSNEDEPRRPARLAEGTSAGDDSPREHRSVMRSTAEIRREGNHLADQPSPYLLQHAHNPVDWFPWGEEALEKARRENKPIFLSIGYSTCHWCHVMEEESFEDDEVARYLNEHFVSIKVDREQRPDIDALYIEAVRRLGGSTGWPLTVFLTPDGVPFYGGTYFPRHGGGRRPGFLDVLREVQRRFTEEENVAAQGRQIFEAIERSARPPSSGERAVSPAAIDAAFARLAGARDGELGGFGRRQKFPNAPLLLAELRYVERTENAAARSHLVLTLEEAMRGGIRDHLAGTFHRYAVDRRWHVPHFEKTLYDNAQLAQVYVEAGRLLGRADFVAVGRAILDDLIAQWQQEDGGFVVGFDADDPGGEGFYYTWTPAELEAVLGAEDARRFATLFGVTAGGERLLEGRSVLHRIPDAQAEARLGMSGAEIEAFVARTAPRLRPVRDRRAPPAIDDKELASWNGLAIIALANVGRWLEEPRYVQAAQRAARFVMERLFEDGVMLRGRRQGDSLGEGFLDDHALPLLGLLRLHAADGDPRWLGDAHRLGRAIIDRFHDAELATFHQSARQGELAGLPLRRPDLDDGVLPSGGNAAALALIELGAIAGDRTMHGLGERAARAAAPRAVESPFGSGFLLVVLDHLVGQSREAVVAGDPDDPRTRALWAEIRPTTPARVLPVRLPASGAPASLVERFGALRGKVALDGAPTAYVCQIGSCELPTSDPAVLREQLDAVGIPRALRR